MGMPTEASQFRLHPEGGGLAKTLHVNDPERLPA